MNTFPLLNELQAIARTGLQFTSSPYDRERYERLLALATEAYSEVLDLPAETIRAQFAQESGVITPKIGTDAAIFNERGEILLMERADGSGWCLPCGFVEPNETPVKGIIREAREETGLEISVKRLVGIFTRKPSPKYGPHTILSVIHLCEIVSGELTLSHEGLALRYWPIEDVKDWHGTHEASARAAYQVWKSPDLPAQFS
jgi:ADP-ribose pyrophosphatase YjhB (NUDIX family)